MQFCDTLAPKRQNVGLLKMMSEGWQGQNAGASVIGTRRHGKKIGPGILSQFQPRQLTGPSDRFRPSGRIHPSFSGVSLTSRAHANDHY